MISRKFALTFSLFFPQSAIGTRVRAEQLTWAEKMRNNTLKNLDDFLNWSFGNKSKKFFLTTTSQAEKIESHFPEMQAFNEKHGYFSLKHPIVAKVSAHREDIDIIRSLLNSIYENVKDPVYLQFAVAEVMTKALAYYDMKKGQSVSIPLEIRGNIVLERFTVDHIFNLWYGMPAFGLVPEKKGIHSILLFRGTDFSLDSKRGWASLMSDLDLAGPGLTAFQNSQKEISLWLQKMHAEDKSARVMGFSLGGALAAYTFIYESQWLAPRDSFSFGAPGVKDKVIADWNALPEERQHGFTTYFNLGDIVPKVGKLFGTVYAFSTSADLKPLNAHTLLITSEPYFYKARVDVGQDNEHRLL